MSRKKPVQHWVKPEHGKPFKRGKGMPVRKGTGNEYQHVKEKVDKSVSLDEFNHWIEWGDEFSLEIEKKLKLQLGTEGFEQLKNAWETGGSTNKGLFDSFVKHKKILKGADRAAHRSVINEKIHISALNEINSIVEKYQGQGTIRGYNRIGKTVLKRGGESVREAAKQYERESGVGGFEYTQAKIEDTLSDYGYHHSGSISKGGTGDLYTNGNKYLRVEAMPAPSGKKQFFVSTPKFEKTSNTVSDDTVKRSKKFTSSNYLADQADKRRKQEDEKEHLKYLASKKW